MIENGPWAVDEHGTLLFANGVACGEVVKDVDGYYYWAPPNRGGTWSAAHLDSLAEFLDYLNAEWDKEVQRDHRPV
jgi:hypothetical protein